jgi:hypothetical protein
MGIVLSVIKKIFKGIIAAFRWVYADNARLREAKARHLGIRSETANADRAQSPRPQHIDVWEEVDHLRWDIWLGGWFGRMRRTHPTKKLDEDITKGR